MWALSSREAILSVIDNQAMCLSRVVVVEEKRCNIKPVIDLSLIKRLKDNMAHKKNCTSATKSGMSSS